MTRAREETAQFSGLWPGGYFEGDPLNPKGNSSYEQQFNLGFLSTLYVTYLMCIRPYVNEGTVVLEIGPGRGAWTKAMLKHNPKQILALDALPAAYNRFWEYVGTTDSIKYYQVEDASCSVVADQSVNFFFSFGCFCHLSRAVTEEYFKNIYNKMLPNSHGFCMISDYRKYNEAVNKNLGLDEELTPKPGRWYHIGTDWFVSKLEEIGFCIVQADIQSNLRDPITHFVKPQRFDNPTHSLDKLDDRVRPELPADDQRNGLSRFPHSLLQRFFEKFKAGSFTNPRGL